MKNVVAVAVIAMLLSACAGTPCTPVALAPNVDTVNCVGGGSICGACEGQHCGGLIFRDYCTTVYIPGGTCRCSCQ